MRDNKALRIVCWIIVVILCSALTGIGVASDGFRDWSKFGGGTQTEQTGGVTDGDGNEMGGDEVHNMPSQMIFRSLAAASQPTEVTVKATVTPDTAENKAVDWTVAFNNSGSPWATGKTATDYVTVTPTSDGSLTAKVACAQAFGEPIVLTVTSRDNPDAKASCQADYLKAYTGIERVNLYLDYDVSAPFITEDWKLPFAADNSIAGGITTDEDGTLPVTVTEGVGTVSDALQNLSMSFTVNPEAKAAMQETFATIEFQTETFVLDDFNGGLELSSFNGLFGVYKKSFPSNYASVLSNMTMRSYIKGLLQTTYADNFFIMTTTVETEHGNSYEFERGLGVDTSTGWSIGVDKIEIDNGSILF